MTHKHMTGCPPLLTIREVQIKIPIKYRYILLRLVKMKIVTLPNAGKGVEPDHSHVAGGNVIWYRTFEKSLAVSYKTYHVTTI